MTDKLSRQSARTKKLKDEQKKIKNSYIKHKNTLAFRDLDKFLEEQSAIMMEQAKNRYAMIDGKLVSLDDGMVLSLMYKSAGLDKARQYIKSKVD